MFNVVLYEPEIPQNTGNIIRLCANQGAVLHLVKPYGFTLDSKKMIRAGLDYREFMDLREHESFDDCMAALEGSRFFMLTSKATTRYDSPKFEEGDAFVFGPETRGLPASVLERFPDGNKLRIPMQPGSRCLNLSNSVAVMLFEAWRSFDFKGGV